MVQATTCAFRPIGDTRSAKGCAGRTVLPAEHAYGAGASTSLGSRGVVSGASISVISNS